MTTDGRQNRNRRRNTNSMASKGSVQVKQTHFGLTAAGNSVDLFTLSNKKDMCVRIINYGGIILSIEVPDREGNVEDITLGFDELKSYEGEHPYFGALIGRYGNRIAGGKFTLDGEHFTLKPNDDPNSLHGGREGFHRRLWKASIYQKDDEAGVILERTSPNMEEGFPGNLETKVIYSLNNENELSIQYEAYTDKPTIVNLTNHTYFNLAGSPGSSILEHVLTIHASRYTPVGESLIPTGELAEVAGTPFDFRVPMVIGDGITKAHEQLALGNGYDHNWVLDHGGGELALSASLLDPTSGRLMEVYTDEPGIQFYSGNFLDEALVGKKEVAYQQRCGLCLETQHYPDSPNQVGFPSARLDPGDVYSSKTVYKFAVEK